MNLNTISLPWYTRPTNKQTTNRLTKGDLLVLQDRDEPLENDPSAIYQ
jgi:hypothetical protein